MTPLERPAVERARPPRAPFDLVNAVVRRLLRRPRPPKQLGEHLLLLHLTGRRTGRPIDVPVAYQRTDDGELLILTNSVWRFNLRGGAPVQMTWRGRRTQAAAQLVEDPSQVAAVYQALIADVGRARAGRRLGIRINVDRTPTHAELAEAARREGLSVVYLDPTRTTS